MASAGVGLAAVEKGWAADYRGTGSVWVRARSPWPGLASWSACALIRLLCPRGKAGIVILWEGMKPFEQVLVRTVYMEEKVALSVGESTAQEMMSCK